MSQFFSVHPETPQARLIQQATNIIRQGGVVVYPTDSAYALGCRLGDKRQRSVSATFEACGMIITLRSCAATCLSWGHTRVSITPPID